MGSGKTTFGRKLAGSLGCDFIDLDEFIEKSTGQSIQEIFSARGESIFRELEREALSKVLSSARGDLVLALGGGTVLDPRNAQLIKEHSVLIYLKVDARELSRRLEGCRTRPLLDGRDPLELLRSREPVYASLADLSFICGE